MSWRIEQTQPLELLAELPDRLVQLCIVRPRTVDVAEDRDEHDRLEVLEQIRRVLRDDGTLWLSLPEPSSAQPRRPWQTVRALQEQGWRLNAHQRSDRYLFLLSKSANYYANPVQPFGLATPRAAHAGRRPWATRRGGAGERRVACLRPTMPSVGGLLERVIQASTAPLACGVCGTAWRPTTSYSWRAGCAHHGPPGRCLVLDLWRASAEAALSAQRLQRDYLGIDQSVIRAEVGR